MRRHFGAITRRRLTVGNLGNLYKDQGKLDKADRMFERALQGYEKYFGFNYPRCRSLCRALVALKDCIETG
jgi:tetratricopeptide (TPR) repeat protein